MKKVLSFILLFFLMSFVSVNGTVEGSSSLSAEIDNKALQLMDKYAVPGACVAVIDDYEITFRKGYGYSDAHDKVPMSVDTAFQVASVSKTLTAWGIMKLVEQGRLDLDAPVSKYLTRWKLPPSEFDNSAVTIRRILSHTAGLSVSSYSGYDPSDEIPTLEESLMGVKNSGAVSVKYPPEKQFKYSGGGYTVLQLVIEEVTNEAFSEFTKREVFVPLNMKKTSYNPEDIEIKAKAHGYFNQIIPTYVFSEKAAAGLFTTVGDLAELALAEMKGKNNEPVGRGVLKEETLKLMQTPVAEMPKKESFYGMGHISRTSEDGTRLVYHPGDNRGWHCIFLVFPEQGKGLVVLTNGDTGIPFYQELTNYFIKAVTKTSTGLYNSIQMSELIVIFIICILSIAWLIYIIKTLRGIKTGKLIPISRNYILRRSIPRIILLLAVICFWWVLFFTGAVYHGWVLAIYMPNGFKTVSLLVGIWCITLMITGFIQKVNKKEV